VITADTLTDEQIRDAISVLETDLAVLEAALKIKTGKFVATMREGAAEVINTRCAEDVERLDARREALNARAQLDRRCPRGFLCVHDPKCKGAA
jgi:hypothetical protein